MSRLDLALLEGVNQVEKTWLSGAIQALNGAPLVSGLILPGSTAVCGGVCVHVTFNLTLQQYRLVLVVVILKC